MATSSSAASGAKTAERTRAGWSRQAPGAPRGCKPTRKRTSWPLVLLALLGILTGSPSHSAPQGTAAPLPDRLQRLTLRSDPRQEYYLYVPAGGGHGARVFITMHGISKNAREHATLFSRYAESYGVVLVAPLFTGERFRDYQRLGREGHGARADSALEAILQEVGASTGASTAKVYLFGFSGGAQFTHRYTMAHPERVARAVVASAGWYTFPDSTLDYPHGIKPGADLPGVRFDPEAFLRIPIAVFVGDRDSTSASMRHDEVVDTQQGTTRFDRARNWVDAMRAAASARHIAPQVSYQMVPGIHHSFRQFMEQGGLGEKTFVALFGPPTPRRDPSTASGGRQ